MIIGITGTIKDDTTRKKVGTVLSQLAGRNGDIIVAGGFAQTIGIAGEDITPFQLGERADLIVLFGGDGTLLAMAKDICRVGTPILGVNTGHLGFLTEFPPDILPDYFDKLLSGNYVVEKRMMIQAKIVGSDDVYLAVNDFVIDKGGFPRALKASLSIEKEYCHTYSSDGIIVATATGSTAYSLSAGGPIVYPSINDILITPICPHTLTARPMIIPPDFEIEIKIVFGPQSISLNADGQPAAVLNAGETVRIGRSRHTFNLVHFPEHNFFRVLRTKMDWGTPAQNNNTN